MKKKIKTSATKISREKITELVNSITDHGNMLAEKKITAGFDGFIDTLVKVIRKKRAQESSILFDTIKEFGNYIVKKHGASLSLEIEERSRKLGGNMPIMANALGQLGAITNCIGAFGYPSVHPVFNKFPPNCHLYSFADPGTATAFEFTDGKIMLAQMGELNSFGWDKLKERISIDTMVALYKQSDLLCLLNWSEIDASTDIWRGILKDVLPKYSFNGKQLAFFDLSDCSKRSDESIKEALGLLQQFATHTKVILGLNKNEARIIYKLLYDKSSKDLFDTGKKIFEKIGIHTLVIHSSKEVVAFTSEENVSVDTFFIPDPKISTGAGDNFNAGFCAAQLLQLSLESSVIFANAVSGHYVRKGTSGQLAAILNFLETIQTPG
jgi:hypothetical protein